MGLTDFLRSQFIEIIEWNDDSRDTLSFRYPDDDKEIKNGAQLIVRESQSVQFVYLGQYGDLFGPGKHTLTTDNIPILSRLKGWKYGFESPFKADVYYLTTRLFTGNKWGTSNPVMVRDQDFGIVRVRAFGTYDFRIVDAPKFLKEVAGTDNHFRLDEFADVMRSRIVSVFSEALATSQGSGARRGHALQRARRRAAADHQSGARREIRSHDAVVRHRERLGPAGSRAGDRQALEHGRGRQPERLREVSDWPRAWRRAAAASPASARKSPSACRWPSRCSISRAASWRRRRRPPARRRLPAAAAIPETIGPADAAKALGVSEADVIASLEAGDLKGKRIGTQWRITKSALADFLK